MKKTTQCPDTIKAKELDGIWRTALQMSASVFKLLIDQGIPVNDARTVLPAILIFSWDKFISDDIQKHE